MYNMYLLYMYIYLSMYICTYIYIECHFAPRPIARQGEGVLRLESLCARLSRARPTMDTVQGTQHRRLEYGALGWVFSCTGADRGSNRPTGRGVTLIAQMRRALLHVLCTNRSRCAHFAPSEAGSTVFGFYGLRRRRGWEEACARNRVVAAGTAHIDTASFDSDSR